MTERTGVIALSHVQLSNGFRIDPGELAKIKGRHALVINAAQSAGVFQIDVKSMQIDALCATGHKWMLAGYGSGFVYLRRELLYQTHSRTLGWLCFEDPFAVSNNELLPCHYASCRFHLGDSPFS